MPHPPSKSRCWMKLATVACAAAFCLIAATRKVTAAETIPVTPLTATIDQPEASLQLLVSQTVEDGRKVDLTRQVKYRSENEKIARVDELGLVTPVADGETGVVVEHAGGSTRVAV